MQPAITLEERANDEYSMGMTLVKVRESMKKCRFKYKNQKALNQ